MGKKNFVPNVVFFIRLALLISIVASMLWINNIVTGVLYLLSLSMLVVEILLGKEMKKNSLFEKYAVPTTNRLLVLLPLVYIAFSQVFNIWMVVIAIFFDIISAFYVYAVGRIESQMGEKAKKSNIKTIYNVYLLMIFVSIFLFFFVPQISLFLLYFSVVVCAVYIILQSIQMPQSGTTSATSDGEQGLDSSKQTTAETSEELSVEIDNAVSRQNEIVE